MSEKSDLPSVGGRRLTECTVADFERRCRILIRDEQEKPNCDTQLIGVLCNAVRLAREQTDLMRAPIKSEPELTGLWGQLRECVEYIRNDDVHDAALRIIAALSTARADDVSAASAEMITAQFHKIWTSQVGTEGYDKDQWQKLRTLLHQRGIDV